MEAFLFVLVSTSGFFELENFLTSLLSRFGVYSLPIFVFHRPLRDAFDYLVLKNLNIEKIKSLNLDKTPKIRGVLQGIKGQYLILDIGVINIRKYTGYELILRA